MNIQSGPGLVSAIAEILNRADLQSVIPSWVQMAEAGLNQTLRTREMVQRSTTVSTTPYIVLPTDFREMKSVRIDDPIRGPQRLFLASEDVINDPRLRGTWSTDPKYFTIVGGEIELSPFPASASNPAYTVEMTYFKNITPLDTATAGATNWLLQKAPQVYLYTALAHSSPYLVEDERLAVWTQFATDAVQSLNNEYKASIQAGSNLREVKKTMI